MASKPEEVKKGAPAWMATFSDLMTQILVFFVFLFTMSSIDLVKARTALVSFSAAFGGYSSLQNSSVFDERKLVSYPETSPDKIMGHEGEDMSLASMSETMHEILFVVKANDKDEQIQGEYNDLDNIEITLKDKLMFESGSATLKQESYPVLTKIGNLLKGINNNIIIEGHTDNLAPKNTSPFKSNWELSSARALSVAQLFINKAGIPANRISIAGYGEHKPLLPNTSEKNRSTNRRVSVIIVKDNISRVY